VFVHSDSIPFQQYRGKMERNYMADRHLTHQLLNELAVILAECELQRDCPTDPNERLQNIEHAAKNMVRIIREYWGAANIFRE
jgi:hypothetical protein